MQAGVCWYKEEQWTRLKEIVADPESIEESYAQWKQQAEQTVNALRAQGLNIVKVSVDTEAMLFWVNSKGLPLDGEARSEYVASVLQQRAQRKR